MLNYGVGMMVLGAWWLGCFSRQVMHFFTKRIRWYRELWTLFIVEAFSLASNPIFS